MRRHGGGSKPILVGVFQGAPRSHTCRLRCHRKPKGAKSRDSRSSDLEVSTPAGRKCVRGNCGRTGLKIRSCEFYRQRRTSIPGLQSCGTELGLAQDARGAASSPFRGPISPLSPGLVRALRHRHRLWPQVDPLPDKAGLPKLNTMLRSDWQAATPTMAQPANDSESERNPGCPGVGRFLACAGSSLSLFVQWRRPTGVRAPQIVPL